MPEAKNENKRMPVVFLPHGGGPWPFMDDEMFGRPGMWDEMRAYMEGLSIFSPERPRALLVISAHWEEAVPTVMTSREPPMYYDYYNFPKETYEIQWPAPGAPEIAAWTLAELGVQESSASEDLAEARGTRRRG